MKIKYPHQKSESQTRVQFGCLYVAACEAASTHFIVLVLHQLASMCSCISFASPGDRDDRRRWRTDFHVVIGELAAPTTTRERPAPTISNPSSQLSIPPCVALVGRLGGAAHHRPPPHPARLRWPPPAARSRAEVGSAAPPCPLLSLPPPSSSRPCPSSSPPSAAGAGSGLLLVRSGPPLTGSAVGLGSGRASTAGSGAAVPPPPPRVAGGLWLRRRRRRLGWPGGRGCAVVAAASWGAG